MPGCTILHYLKPVGGRPGPGAWLAVTGQAAECWECVRRDTQWPVSQGRPERQHHDTAIQVRRESGHKQ